MLQNATSIYKTASQFCTLLLTHTTFQYNFKCTGHLFKDGYSFQPSSTTLRRPLVISPISVLIQVLYCPLQRKLGQLLSFLVLTFKSFTMTTGLLFATPFFFFLTQRYDFSISYENLSEHQDDFILNSYKFTESKIRNSGEKGTL